ncbi:hypothetical protein [Prescottella subtropica]|uniref:hypothetical protein n=1 Tax=Prescottella subtropica TaxID=2545757 RepID=UPI001386FAE0|nr:hypothetical protein [Prescottella subtropica]
MIGILQRVHQNTHTSTITADHPGTVGHRILDRAREYNCIVEMPFSIAWIFLECSTLQNECTENIRNAQPDRTVTDIHHAIDSFPQSRSPCRNREYLSAHDVRPTTGGQVVCHHDVDLVVTADEPMHRTFSDRQAQFVAELLELIPHSTERRGTGLDMQHHVDVDRDGASPARTA